MHNPRFLPGDLRATPAARRPDVPLGTAAWKMVIEQDDLRERTGDIRLGTAPDGTMLGNRDDRHILIVGGARGGKGISAIVPALITWRGSVVVIDPKGENAMVTLRQRGRGSQWSRGYKQPTFLLDPYREVVTDECDYSEYRCCFNPLDTLDPKGAETVADAGRIADALIDVERSKDPYWEESGRSFLRNLILHTLTAPDFEAHERNLVTVRRLVLAGDWKKREISALYEADGDLLSGYELLFDSMRRNQAFGSVISDAGAYYADQYQNARRTFASIVSVAVRALDFLDDEPMRTTMSRSDFKLSDLKTRRSGVSLYLSLPQRLMETHYGWLRMMATLVVTEMEKVKGKPASGRSVLLVLDEFPALKRMRAIENAAAQIAGAGVKMVFVAQTLAQLKDVYKDNWETFVANSGLRFFFGNDDHFTREYVSKLAGDMEVARVGRSASKTEGSSYGFSSTVTGGHSSGSTSGWSHNTTMGGRGGSESMGFNSSHTSGTSFSTASATNSSVSNSRTAGESESIQKRPLITPDEVGRMFGDRSMRMGLLLISGSQPIPIRREFYFESKSLRGYYDPHRDFPSPPTLVELDAIIAREKRKAEEAAERKRRIADEESQRKRKEEEIAAWNRERRAEVARMRAEWDAKPWWQKFHWPQTRKFLRNVAILFTAIGVGMWWLMS